MNQVSVITLLFLALRGDSRESGTGFGKLALLGSSGRKPIRAQKEKLLSGALPFWCEVENHRNLYI